MHRLYLVRFGMMHHVGRFAADGDVVLNRDQPVVVQTVRGTEMGRILADLGEEEADLPRVRPATAEDFARAHRADQDRDRRLSACEMIFRDGQWPLELIDVEALLDDHRTVLHYLGPHRLDASGLIQILRERCGLDVILSPAGRDVPDEIEDEDLAEEDHGCGSCSSGGGGCGTKSGSEGGCSGCSVKDLVKNRAVVVV